MEIDESDGHEKNADLAIDESLATDSKVRIERDLHPRKQSLPSLSTEEGMPIDESDGHEENADSSIEES
jgi:hypothetical protein